MEENKQQIDIELSHDIAQGIYANLAIITHSSSEFILDFVRVVPGVPKAEVKSRIIMSPEHAKRLLWALQDNIRKYEQTYRKITLPEEPQNPPVFPLGSGASRASLNPTEDGSFVTECCQLLLSSVRILKFSFVIRPVFRTFLFL